MLRRLRAPSVSGTLFAPEIDHGNAINLRRFSCKFNGVRDNSDRPVQLSRASCKITRVSPQVCDNLPAPFRFHSASRLYYVWQ